MWPFKRKKRIVHNRENDIGYVLKHMGFVTQEQICQACAAQRSNPQLKMGEILIEQGALTDAELKEALKVQRNLRTDGQEATGQLKILQKQMRRTITKQNMLAMELRETLAHVD